MIRNKNHKFFLSTVRTNHSSDASSSPDLRSTPFIAFSQFFCILQWHCDKRLPITVTGSYRILTGFSIHPRNLGTCTLYSVLKYLIFHILTLKKLFVYTKMNRYAIIDQYLKDYFKDTSRFRLTGELAFLIISVNLPVYLRTFKMSASYHFL